MDLRDLDFDGVIFPEIIFGKNTQVNKWTTFNNADLSRIQVEDDNWNIFGNMSFHDNCSIPKHISMNFRKFLAKQFNNDFIIQSDLPYYYKNNLCQLSYLILEFIF